MQDEASALAESLGTATGSKLCRIVHSIAKALNKDPNMVEPFVESLVSKEFTLAQNVPTKLLECLKHEAARRFKLKVLFVNMGRPAYQGGKHIYTIDLPRDLCLDVVNDFVLGLPRDKWQWPQITQIVRKCEGDQVVVRLVRKVVESVKRRMREQFLRKAYVPELVAGDTLNPRWIKFGGAIPYLPELGPPLCGECTGPMNHMFTVYVKRLPDEIQSVFPECARECVIDCCHCSHCLEDILRQFYDDEIDRLVWAPDGQNGVAQRRGIIRHRPLNDPMVWTGKFLERPDCVVDSYYLDEWGWDLFHFGLSFNPDCVYRMAINEIRQEEGLSSEDFPVYETKFGGFPRYCQYGQEPERPNHDSVLLMNFKKGEALTYGEYSDGENNIWIDCSDECRLIHTISAE